MPADRPNPPADDDATLLGWLADRDVACPLCGYNLRGLTSARCPECGRPLRLGVSLADPFLAAWVATAVAACAAGGAGVFLLCIIVAEGHVPPVSPVCLVSMAGFVTAIPLAVATVRFLRRFQRWPRGTQVLVAVAAAVLAVGNTAVFFATVH